MNQDHEDQCNGATTARQVPTPVDRLIERFGWLAQGVLKREGLIVIEADSPRAVWHDTLGRARDLGDAAGVAQLIAVGAQQGWL